jgi:hypothetical protein
MHQVGDSYLIAFHASNGLVSPNPCYNAYINFPKRWVRNRLIDTLESTDQKKYVMKVHIEALQSPFKKIPLNANMFRKTHNISNNLGMLYAWEDDQLHGQQCRNKRWKALCHVFYYQTMNFSVDTVANISYRANRSIAWRKQTECWNF